MLLLQECFCLAYRKACFHIVGFSYLLEQCHEKIALCQVRKKETALHVFDSVSLYTVFTVCSQTDRPEQTV